jgi:hypothetical protein
MQAAFDIAETHQPLFTIVEPSVQKFEDSASKNLFSKYQRQMMVLLIGCILVRIEADFHLITINQKYAVSVDKSSPEAL